MKIHNPKDLDFQTPILSFQSSEKASVPAQHKPHSLEG